MSIKRTVPVDGVHGEASRIFKLTTELQMSVRVEDSWQHLMRQRRWCHPESLCERVGHYAALPISCLPSPPQGVATPWGWNTCSADQAQYSVNGSIAQRLLSQLKKIHLVHQGRRPTSPPAMSGATPVPKTLKNHLLVLRLSLHPHPHWMQPSLLSSVSLLFLLVRVALQMKLRSLGYHTSRLCRISVFLIQTIVLCVWLGRHGQDTVTWSRWVNTFEHLSSLLTKPKQLSWVHKTTAISRGRNVGERTSVNREHVARLLRTVIMSEEEGKLESDDNRGHSLP